MAIFPNLASTVGRTPLIELGRFVSELKLEIRILGKLESQNPTYSLKDRIAVAMIEAAVEEGQLRADSIIVCASSGNTGIAMASAAASMGYAITVVLPENTAPDRIRLLRLLGANVETTAGGKMALAVSRAAAICENDSQSVLLRSFEDLKNPSTHHRTTAAEIWQDCDGEIDCFVAGVGTGGTIVGVGEFLKEKSDEISIVAVEPITSSVLRGHEAGPHSIEGIGAGFIPPLLKSSHYDEVLAVSDEQARDMILLLSRTEGIMSGFSSGANLAAVVEIAKRPQMAGKTIVTILGDSAERYLSSTLGNVPQSN